MRVIQIPFSHNCVKVRRALELKGLPYETLDVLPMNRAPVVAASGQGLVPVLEDDGGAVADSTAILRHLEAAHPEPSLLPEDPAQHAACWLIEDWVDGAFMKLTRRLAYWQRIQATPDLLADRFFPGARGLKRWVMLRVACRAIRRRFGLSPERNRGDERELPRVARLALDRLGGRPFFFGERITLADVTLAAMTGPALVAGEGLRRDPAVADLLAWSRPILGDEVLRLYDLPAGRS